MIKVADFIADYLYKQGITDIFMLSGGGAIHLDQAVANHPGLREVCIKNEATGPMMAKAYAQVTKNFGVVYVTTGPGGANAITGVVECFVDSSPVLVISGQAPLVQTTHHAKIEGLRSFGVQELNIIEVVKSITKYASMVTQAEDVLCELQRAIHIMKSGRPGPVWLDIPLDIQSEEIDPDLLRSFTPSVRPYYVATTELRNLVKVLKKAERPLIVAGQGVRGAEHELRWIAETLNVPIILSRMGLDTIPAYYQLNMGIGGFKGTKYNKQIMREADVVLAVGTSLSVAFAGHDLSFFDKSAKIYMVDIEESEGFKFLGRGHNRLEKLFLCTAKLFLGSLRHELLSTPTSELSPWAKHCISLKEEHSAIRNAPQKNPIDIYYLTKMVDEMSTADDVFVDDAGSIYYVASQTLTFNKGQREVTSGAYASMGNAIPLSIGCAIANPTGRVLAMTGDGSLETNVQELKTLSYYDLNVKLFVINNGGYISMRDHGRNTIDESNAMLNLKKIADAYDMPYYLVEKWEDFEWVRGVVKKRGPAFFEVLCDSNQKLIVPL